MTHSKNDEEDPENEAGTLKKMIYEVKNTCPLYQKYPTYPDLLDFVVAHPDYSLDSEDIRFLIEYSMPPLGQYRDDFFTVFDTVLTAAKQTRDPDLIKDVYQSGLAFYENHERNAKKMELLQEGIDWFLLRNLPHCAGELYLKLAWAYVDAETRLHYCRQAIRYLDKSSVQYGCARASEEFLCEMVQHTQRSILLCVTYGQKLIRKDGVILQAPLTYCYSTRQPMPGVLCRHLPILKGFHKWNDPWGYADMDKLLFDEALAVGDAYDWQNTRVEDQVIHTQDGKEYSCRVLVRRREDQLVTSYFAENVGLVRVVLQDERSKATYQFDLCGYSLVGGDGFFPLAVGNRWNYRQIDYPDTISQIISREIVSQSGEEYLISGLDYIAE